MAISNLISNMLFLSIRSCSKSSLRLSPSTTMSDADYIGSIQEPMRLISSFLSPLFATVCFLIFGLEVYAEIKNDVWGLLTILAGIQALQAIAAMVVVHSPHWRNDEGQSKFNKCMPVFQYVLIVLLFAVSPVLISIGYIYILSTPMETRDLYSYFTLVFVLSILLSTQFFGHLIGDFERLKT